MLLPHLMKNQELASDCNRQNPMPDLEASVNMYEGLVGTKGDNTNRLPSFSLIRERQAECSLVHKKWTFFLSRSLIGSVVMLRLGNQSIRVPSRPRRDWTSSLEVGHGRSRILSILDLSGCILTLPLDWVDN